jgi:hypothetical protein
LTWSATDRTPTASDPAGPPFEANAANHVQPASPSGSFLGLTRFGVLPLHGKVGKHPAGLIILVRLVVLLRLRHLSGVVMRDVLLGFP